MILQLGKLKVYSLKMMVMDEFTKGGFLLTHYETNLQSSIVTIKIPKTEGLWKRPERRLHVQLLLGEYSMTKG
ncbi:hypothetical protein V2J09_020325 [Rumex salicifolius]